MPAYLFFEILVGIFTCLIGIGNCLMCYHCTKNQEIEDLGTCHNSADLGVLKTCKPEEICIDTKVLIRTNVMTFKGFKRACFMSEAFKTWEMGCGTDIAQDGVRIQLIYTVGYG